MEEYSIFDGDNIAIDPQRIWTVYIHIIPKEINDYDYDKYYVGITKLSVNKRWKHNGSGYKDQMFRRAINKYGWDNIQHEIICEHLTENEAKQFEKRLIKELGSFGKYGYNRNVGGDGGGNKKDISGSRFGNLTVVRKDDSKNNFKDEYWICKCDCGNIVSKSRNMLYYKGFLACDECNAKRRSDISHNINLKYESKIEKIYKIWLKLRSIIRGTCKDKSYANINAYEKWANDYTVFHNWCIDNGYQDGYTFIRLDKQKGFYPDNCTWVDPSELKDIKVTGVNVETKIIEYNGIKLDSRGWANKLNIPVDVFRHRLLTMSIEKAIELPYVSKKER